MQKVYLPSSFTKCNENCGLPDFLTDYQIRHLSNPSGLPEILPKIDPCHIRDLRRIRRHIPLSTAKTISNALISSRLDYCNSLINNIAKQDLSKLQRMQNCLARVVLRAPRFSPSLPLLKRLH